MTTMPNFDSTVALVYVAIMLVIDFWWQDGYGAYGKLYINAHVFKLLFTAVIVGLLPSWTATSTVANILMASVPMSIHFMTCYSLDWYVGRVHGRAFLRGWLDE